MSFLDDPNLNVFIDSIDEVGFHLLRFSVGVGDRAYKDYLYRCLAFGRNLNEHYRVVIERVTRFWLRSSRRALHVDRVTRLK
jgi:hypothetical protein